MQINQITKVLKIFVDKKWTNNDQYETVFENFCQLILNLDDEQQDLILELSERYSWISPNEYNHHITKALEGIDSTKISNCNRLIIFPIMKPEDESNVKSGLTIVYLIKGLLPMHPKYRHLEIEELIKYQDITEDKLKLTDSDHFILVDDFLGSGETIRQTLQKVLQNPFIKKQQISVVTVATQQASIDYVSSQGIDIYYSHIEQKGISDFYSDEVAKQKLSIMSRIEENIPSNFNSFGYNRSEALITLIRTPDNTFPIFWQEHSKNGKKYSAPFPRHQ